MANPPPDLRRHAWLFAALVLAAAPAAGLAAVQAGAALATAGPDTLVGGPGADTLQGMGGGDSIRGMEGDDLVNGNGGDDTVGGGPGADVVHGGQGRDRVNGGQGDDTVAGDRDDDTVTGGLGADLFLFDRTSGSDVVTDFASAGGDRIGLPAGADYALADTADGAVVTLTGGGRLRLAGVRVAELGTWLAAPAGATAPAVVAARPTLPITANPPAPPRRMLLAAIVALAVAFVGLLSVGLVQLVRGPRN
ncbi:MAG TPA: calcium-binding protein [Caulobacteraceae bacterium]|nr:calcium-binding protein [Caulobacteraceae bacterium]